MGRVLDWASEIEVIAGPMLAGDTRESWLARAARRAGITFRQCKGLFYGETDDPKMSVGICVVAAAQSAREEALQLASKFESLAGGMIATDHATNQDIYSADVLALVSAARRLRGVARA